MSKLIIYFVFIYFFITILILPLRIVGKLEHFYAAIHGVVAYSPDHYTPYQIAVDYTTTAGPDTNMASTTIMAEVDDFISTPMPLQCLPLSEVSL